MAEPTPTHDAPKGPTKPNHMAKMVEKTEEHLAAVQEQILAGGMTPEQEADAMAAAEAMVAKIERLNGISAKLEGLKKAK